MRQCFSLGVLTGTLSEITTKGGSKIHADFFHAELRKYARQNRPVLYGNYNVNQGHEIPSTRGAEKERE
jgi:hypothetical protein